MIVASARCDFGSIGLLRNAELSCRRSASSLTAAASLRTPCVYSSSDAQHRGSSWDVIFIMAAASSVGCWCRRSSLPKAARVRIRRHGVDVNKPKEQLPGRAVDCARGTRTSVSSKAVAASPVLARKVETKGNRKYVPSKKPDRPSRFHRSDLKEDYLIENMKHVLVAYYMCVKPGRRLEEAAKHFAAEASIGRGKGRWPSRFTETCGAFVYSFDEVKNEVRVAFHVATFDRSFIDGAATASSVLGALLGCEAGMRDLEFCEARDVFFPYGFLRLFPGPAINMADLWRTLERNRGLIVGATLRPRLGMLAHEIADLCQRFWRAGDVVSTGATAAGVNAPFCPLSELAPAVATAMRASIAETGQQKLFIANISCDDTADMIARGRYILEQFGPLAPNCAFLVDGTLSGGLGALSAARRAFPAQFLLYQGAGAVQVWNESQNASDSTSVAHRCGRGISALVHTKLARALGASGVQLEVHRRPIPADGATGSGQPNSLTAAAQALPTEVLEALHADVQEMSGFAQEWQRMPSSAQVLCINELNPLHLPGVFEQLGHSNVVLLAGDGVIRLKGGPGSGAEACRQVEDAWRQWRSAAPGKPSLQEAVVRHSNSHQALKRTFWSFPDDADEFYPGWRGENEEPEADFASERES